MKIAAVLLFCVSVLFGFGSYASVLEANWEIDLPRGYSEKCSADSGASFHGDGFRYHVFHYDETEAVSALLEWDTDQSLTYAKWTDEWSEQWGVPIETDVDLSQIPSWSKVKQDSSRLILFWDACGGCLYIVENII